MVIVHQKRTLPALTGFPVQSQNARIIHQLLQTPQVQNFQYNTFKVLQHCNLTSFLATSSCIVLPSNVFRGTYGAYEYCQPGTYVNGLIQKYTVGETDETGMTGIHLICRDASGGQDLIKVYSISMSNNSYIIGRRTLLHQRF